MKRNNRNGINSLAVAFVICCGLLLCVLIWFKYLHDNQPKEQEVETYAKSTVVVDVNYNTDVVTVEDFNGFTWQFDGCEDWAEGDICAMVMSDNNTPETIFDDIIINTNYCGYVY